MTELRKYSSLVAAGREIVDFTPQKIHKVIEIVPDAWVQKRNHVHARARQSLAYNRDSSSWLR